MPKVYLEDGFISYVSRSNSFPRLSTVFDYQSIYYDSEESTLNSLILEENSNIDTIKSTIIKYKENSISKYNHLREYSGELPESYILLVDQVFGDLSVKLGNANSDAFQLMLSSALSENLDCKIILKVHPDVYAKNKRGYFKIKDFADNPRIKLISQNCHPVRLIKNARAIYTVTSQVGFEALIWGKKVKCFGMPFYAGWGLTEDVLPVPKKRKNVSLEQLVHASLVKYPIYQDPETKERSTVDKIINYIGFQRKMRFRFPEKLYAFGFTPWKKSILRSFTQGSELTFVNQFKDIPAYSTLLVWGSVQCNSLSQTIKIIRVEDGFLRSVGLGCDLIPPQSWVFDDEGIYYDSSRPSKLENILNYTEFKNYELNRADDLIQKLVFNRISKYNLGYSRVKVNSSSKTTILVVGQVEDDASLKFGTSSINSNLKLLKTVRERFPKSYIIYKPHPDEVAGVRKQSLSVKLGKDFYDEIVDSGDAISLFDAVDSVHTMTSLVGFEALLRNKEVYTYGQPFYSGWGLTIDAIKVNRRQRQLNLRQLVVGCLIHYPTYISEASKMYTTPERVIEELLKKKSEGSLKQSLWLKFIRCQNKLWKHIKNFTISSN